MNYFHYNTPDLFVTHTCDDTPSQSRFYMHTHAFTEVYCFVAGNAVFHVEGTAYTLEPGDLLLMRPGEAHYVQVDTTTPYERITINFDTGMLGSLDPDRVLTRAILERKAGKRNRYRMGQDGIRMMKQITARNTRMNILGNLILLLQELNEQFSAGEEKRSDSDTLEYRVIRYINKNLSRELTLQELCEHFFVSRTQLCRLFKQATGTSVGSYITGKRLLTARELLLAGNKPTEVYAACGYRDYSTFFRAYMKFFEHSPRDAHTYRNAITPDTHILLG